MKIVLISIKRKTTLFEVFQPKLTVAGLVGDANQRELPLKKLKFSNINAYK